MKHEQIAATGALPVKPKVYSYSRWSTPEQAKGDSNRRQAEAAAKWAARHGYELDERLRIIDEGVSAYRGGNALDGGLSRFLEACRKGLIDPGSFLLVESLRGADWPGEQPRPPASCLRTDGAPAARLGRME